MMQTNTGSLPATTLRRTASPAETTQKVAIVNGSPDSLALVENVLRSGHYDVVFIESVAHAYSHIKRAQPNLVIICMCFDDLETFNVLSMLKLDEDTRQIPVLTYTTGFDGDSEDETHEEETSALEMFASQPEVMMN